MRMTLGRFGFSHEVRVVGALVSVLVTFLTLTLSAQVPTTAQQTTASISGFVARADTGQRVPRARVALTELQSNEEATATVIAGDDGSFTFSTIPPGSYRLTATRDGYLMADHGQRRVGKPGVPVTIADGQKIVTVSLVMVPMGAITGRVYDQYWDPVHKATVQAFKYAYRDGRRMLTPVQKVVTNDLGEYRLYWMLPGQYIISASLPTEAERTVSNGRTSAASRSQAQDGLQQSLPVYFSGAMDPASASPVDLPSGGERGGVDFLLADTRAARVTGRVVDGRTGRAVNAPSVSLFARGTVLSRLSATVSAGGAFEFRNIPPGSYEMVAMAQSPDRLAASVPIEIANADMEGLSVAVREGFKIAGRVFVDGQPAKGDGIDVSSISVRLQSAAPEISVGGVRAAADGTFAFNAVSAGEYLLQVSGLPRGAYVKAAHLGRADLLGWPVRFESSSQDLLEIWVSRGAAAVDAVALDEQRRPISAATVVLVPDASRRHRRDLYRAVSTDGEGRAHLEGIEPGDYQLFAWDDIESGIWQDQDFLRLNESRGTNIRLDEGAKQQIALTAIN